MICFSLLSFQSFSTSESVSASVVSLPRVCVCGSFRIPFFKCIDCQILAIIEILLMFFLLEKKKEKKNIHFWRKSKQNKFCVCERPAAYPVFHSTLSLAPLFLFDAGSLLRVSKGKLVNVFSASINKKYCFFFGFFFEFFFWGGI